MIRKLFVTGTVIFAIVGLGTALLRLPRLLMNNEPDSVISFPSPDGAYKAVLAQWAGGNPLSSYCYQRLTVVPSLLPVAKQSSEKMAVFATSCTTAVVPPGERSPSFNWEGNTRLRVCFSIAETSVAPGDFTLRKQDETGNVTVEFEILR